MGEVCDRLQLLQGIKTPEESQVMAAATILAFFTIYPFGYPFLLHIQKQQRNKTMACVKSHAKC
jgi:hypothetical protein